MRSCQQLVGERRGRDGNRRSRSRRQMRRNGGGGMSATYEEDWFLITERGGGTETAAGEKIDRSRVRQPYARLRYDLDVFTDVLSTSGCR